MAYLSPVPNGYIICIRRSQKIAVLPIKRDSGGDMRCTTPSDLEMMHWFLRPIFGSDTSSVSQVRTSGNISGRSPDEDSFQLAVQRASSASGRETRMPVDGLSDDSSSWISYIKSCENCYNAWHTLGLFTSQMYMDDELLADTSMLV